MDMAVLKKLGRKKVEIMFSLFCLLTLVSCEREANVKLPETDPKPVLACFISPEDTLIRVHLTNSRPLYVKNKILYPLLINNAVITISNGASSVLIPWINDSLGYQLSTQYFNIEPGKTYILEAKIPDGRVVSAHCTVPNSAFPEYDFTVQKVITDSSEYGVQYELLFEYAIHDIAEEQNYYRLVNYYLHTDSFPILHTNASISHEEYISDKGKDGLTQKVKGNVYAFTPNPNNPGMQDSKFITYLMMCNDSYYHYHKDLYTNSGGNNPFSEAKINYSNIVGGIGCFGAYRMVRNKFQ